jgi:hypothetical protein
MQQMFGVHFMLPEHDRGLRCLLQQFLRKFAVSVVAGGLRATTTLAFLAELIERSVGRP